MAREASIRPVEGYGVTRIQEVEFRDLDGLGHVNNAVYLSYLESAKVQYFREVVQADDLSQLGIVADAKIAYRSPAFFGERLEIGVRVPHVGTKSLHFEFEIRGPDGRLVAEASSVHVTFDYGKRESMEIPEAWRERIEAHEAERLAPR
jgi:acyl-CoA thioester hydrolase